MSDDFHSILANYYASDLNSIREAAGLPAESGSDGKLLKKDVVSLLAEALVEPARVRAAYDRLDATERAVLEHVQLRHTYCPTLALQQQLLAAGIVVAARQPDSYGYRKPSYTGKPTPRSSRIFEDVLARLTLNGLVFSYPGTSSHSNARASLSPAAVVMIPAAIARHLPPPVHLSDRLAGWQPEQIAGWDPQLVVRDLYLYWAFCRQEGLALIKSGHLSKRSLRAVNAALIMPENVEDVRGEVEVPRLLVLRETLQAAGLLRPDDSGLQAVDKPAFWQAAPQQLVEQMLAAGQRLASVLDVQRDRSFDTQPAAAFALLCKTLAAGKSAEWLTLVDLVARLIARSPGFYVPARPQIEEHRYEYGSFGTAFQGSPHNALAKVHALELAFVRHAVEHVLMPLGIVVVGQGKHAGETLQALQLTRFGHAVLQKTPYVQRGDDGQLIVQPTFQLLALGQVPLATLAQVERFAERVKVDRNVFEYTLTRDSVYAAQQEDLPAAAIIAFLEQASGNPLPQNVRRSLEEWGVRHERIVFRTPVTLVQTADAAQLDALRDDPATAKAIGDRLSDTMALVRPHKRAKLEKTLIAAGRLPTLDRGDRGANSVVIAPDGHVTIRQKAPSLFITGQLAHFAEQVKPGVWRITQAAFERNAGDKAATARFLAELTHLHDGQLPAELVRQIKIWGNYYGTAALGTLTLLAFQDAETLAELTQHATLKGLLTPFPGATQPLAVVRAAAVDTVRDYLRQLGIETTDLDVGRLG